MNTRKQVLIMSALLMLMLITIGIYGAWYPSRETDAEAYFEEATAERGSILFARNCRLCHGDIGQGGAAGARLPSAPALDRSVLQGFDDSNTTTTANITARGTTLSVSNGAAFKAGSLIIVDEERMKVTAVSGNDLTVQRAQGHTEAEPHFSDSPVLLFDEAFLNDQLTMMRNTIVCGRVGTAMPAWSQEHGGPLSDEQIRQLLVLISNDYWDLVEHEVDIEDKRTELAASIDGEEQVIEVKDITVLNEGEAYRIGEERMRVTLKVVTPGEKEGTVVVERGVLGTIPADHAEGETVFLFPEVAEPAILQTSCGQTARPATPSEPPGLIEPFDGLTIEVVAQNILFDLKTITAPANTQIRVRLDNKDVGVDHNIAFYPSATNTSTPLVAGAIGTIYPGPGVDDTVFTTPAAGSYFFRCDVHPTSMTGTFTVQ